MQLRFAVIKNNYALVCTYMEKIQYEQGVVFIMLSSTGCLSRKSFLRNSLSYEWCVSSFVVSLYCIKLVVAKLFHFCRWTDRTYLLLHIITQTTCIFLDHNNFVDKHLYYNRCSYVIMKSDIFVLKLLFCLCDTHLLTWFVYRAINKFELVSTTSPCVYGRPITLN